METDLSIKYTDSFIANDEVGSLEKSQRGLLIDLLIEWTYRCKSILYYERKKKVPA